MLCICLRPVDEYIYGGSVRVYKEDFSPVGSCIVMSCEKLG